MMEEQGINITDSKVEEEVRIAINTKLTIELPFLFSEDLFEIV